MGGDGNTVPRIVELPPFMLSNSEVISDFVAEWATPCEVIKRDVIILILFYLQHSPSSHIISN